MDAGVNDPLQPVDRAGQLALKGSLIVEVLGKIGGAEAGAVEKLEAHAPTSRQALRRHREPQIVHLVRRYLDRPSTLRKPVIDFQVAQLTRDRARILRLQVREKHAVS